MGLTLAFLRHALRRPPKRQSTQEAHDRCESAAGKISASAPCCPYRLQVWPPPGAAFCRQGSSSAQSRTRSFALLAAASRSRRLRPASLISALSEGPVLFGVGRGV